MDVSDELGGGLVGGVKMKSPRRFLEHLDGAQDVLLGFLAETSQVPQLRVTGELFHLPDRARLERLPEQRHFLRAERLQGEKIEQRVRVFLQQLLPEAVVALGEDLLDVFGHAVADAGQFGELFGVLGELFDRLGEAGDQLGGALVAAVAANLRAIYLQQLRRLAEDAGDFTVVHGNGL